MFLSWVGPRSVDGEIEPSLDLPVGVLRQADRAGLGDPFEPRGDIDPVAHQIAVAFLDDVAEMDADAELDAALGRQPGVALDHAVLNFDRAAHGVDHAVELDQRAVAGALDDAAMMKGDGRVDQVAAQRPQPRERALLVRAREPAVADNVGGQDRRKFPGFAHRVASRLDRDYHERRPSGARQRVVILSAWPDLTEARPTSRRLAWPGARFRGARGSPRRPLLGSARAGGF